MKTFISQIANRGQVFKHTLLIELLRNLITAKSENASSRNFPFHYLETHAGKPLHILPAEGEWQEGMGEYWDKPKKETSDFALLKYAPKGRTKLRRYPSSWAMVKQVAEDAGCSNLKMTLFDTSAEVTQDIKALEDRAINFISGDAWKDLGKHIKEVDFVFIDPDYRNDKDWGSALKTAQSLMKRGIPFALFVDEENPKSRRLEKELNVPFFQYHEGQQVGMFVSGVSKDVLSAVLTKVDALEGVTTFTGEDGRPIVQAV
jgi:23S rRNA A2030 N6-methylase RlmJ